MPRHSILIVEDEADVAEVLEFNLEREGFRALLVTDGRAAVELARSKRPDLVLLDVMLPVIDGIEVARALKADESTRAIPIIMISAKAEESDIVLGLGIGADDYIVKPFRTREVLARVRAVLRRHVVSNADRDGPIEHGALRIEPRSFAVWLEGDEVRLTLKEFRILSALAATPGRVFTRSRLLDVIEGDELVGERNIDVHITAVRRKLGAHKDLIVTVRGVGYKFREPARSPRH